MQSPKPTTYFTWRALSLVPVLFFLFSTYLGNTLEGTDPSTVRKSSFAPLFASSSGQNRFDNSLLTAAFLQTTKLEAWDEKQQDHYGESIAIDGDIAVVGAGGVDRNVFDIDTGAAYVFVRRGLLWLFQQKLVASDGEKFDGFGMEVAVAGETIVVSTTLDDINGVENQGSAYVFVKSGSKWVEQQKLTASDGAIRDAFGSSVSIFNNTVLVGAYSDDIGSNGNQGSVYIFTRNGVSWTQQAKLMASDGTETGAFGSKVAVHNDWAIIGAPEEKTGSGYRTGAAYLFQRLGSTWTQQRKLEPVPPELFGNEYFGLSVALSNETAVVGARNQGSPTRSQDGAAYVYSKEVDSWGAPTKLTAPDAAGYDHFGSSVAVDNDQIFVGAYGTDVGDNWTHGAAYVFARQSDKWIAQSKLSPVTEGTTSYFGNGIAVFDGTALISSPAYSFGKVFSFRDTTNAPDLRAESDTGLSAEDNITNSSELNFDVLDVNIGAIVDLIANDQVVDSVVAANVAVTLSDLNPPADGNVRYSVRQKMQDSSTLMGAPSVVTLDNSRPLVTIDQATGQQDPTSLFPINYQVNFSEPVTGFDINDVTFAGSTVNVESAVVSITGAGSTYNIAVSIGVPSGGILRLSVVSGAVVDYAENVNFGSTSIDNSVAFDPILDGGFELTATGQKKHWGSTSTAFATSLCTLARCGDGAGTAGPRNGVAWVWFDGASGTSEERSSVSQPVIFPLSGEASLSYHLRIGFVSEPFKSSLEVKIDGVVVQTITEPSVAETGYTRRSVDVSAFADGASHTISFEYFRPAGGVSANFSLDDVSLLQAPEQTSVTVSGRVMTSDGRGLRNAVVSLVDAQNNRRTTMTSSLGYYSFENALVGTSITVSVSAKRYRFDPRAVNVTAALANVDFTGLE